MSKPEIVGNFLGKILVRIPFVRKRLFRYCDWKNYEIGFTGKGPTAFDKKPKFKKPWIPEGIRKRLDEEFRLEAEFRARVFEMSIREVLGEDF